jgi:hypothetical protein
MVVVVVEEEEGEEQKRVCTKSAWKERSPLAFPSRRVCERARPRSIGK